MTHAPDRLKASTLFQDDCDFPWEDAFSKFGFDDGDLGWMTDRVADRLRTAGYTIDVVPWPLHNQIIERIEKDGIEHMPGSGIVVGYDDPRDYLSGETLALLDAAL